MTASRKGKTPSSTRQYRTREPVQSIEIGHRTASPIPILAQKLKRPAKLISRWTKLAKNPLPAFRPPRGDGKPGAIVYVFEDVIPGWLSSHDADAAKPRKVGRPRKQT